MSKKKHLIIGCGPAAISAIDTMRALDQENEIRVVWKEDNLPYSPAALPYVLAGRTGEGGLFPRGKSYFESRGVTFVPGKEAVRIVPEKKKIIYKDGDTEEYDSLLVACGAEPASQGLDGETELLKFHSLGDLRRLISELKASVDATILGAGMVAVELAVALTERGCKARLLGRGRPLRAYFDEGPGAFIREILTERGIDIQTGRIISQVKRNGQRFEIHCADGKVFETGMVVSCLGVTPRLGLIEGSGISANRGILCDRKMRTNLDNVYAAGDVVEAPSFRNGDTGVCAILPEAIAQGKVAGSNMVGKELDYEGWVPVNLLKFFGQAALSAGAVETGMPDAEVLEKKDSGTRRFERLVFTDGRLIGGMFVNVEIDPGVMLYLIKKRVTVGQHKRALLEEPAEVSRWLMLNSEKSSPS